MPGRLVEKFPNVIASEAKQSSGLSGRWTCLSACYGAAGLLRRSASRNDDGTGVFQVYRGHWC